MTLISQDITKAADFLNREEIIAIPTETVYGLAGNIYSEKAIKSVFEMKKRPLFNPLIVHIHDIAQLEELAEELPEKAKVLAAAFWPGPLTMILPKKENVPDLITAGHRTVAVRMPNHPVTLELLRSLKFPLAAPSANPFGCISPTTAFHVADYFHGELPMVLEGGPCEKGIESTIIGFEGDEVVLYRLGTISVEAIENVIGKVHIKNKKEDAPEAPGMLERHYAPQTPTFLENDINAAIAKFPGKRIGLLLFKERTDKAVSYQCVLSANGNLHEAAQKLYATLHQMDKMDLDVIIAERFPGVGLGKTINDRLERAAKS